MLHVREAPPEDGARSAATLRERAEDVTGAHVLPGHGVVELLTRATSKALAIAELRDELGAGAVVFVGDDRTDEEVFAAARRRRLLDPGRALARRWRATVSPAPPRCCASSQALTDLV